MSTVDVVAEAKFGGIKMPWDDWGKSIQSLLNDSIEGFAAASWEFLKNSFSAGAFTKGGGAQDWWIAVMGGTVNVSVEGQHQYSMEYPGMLNVMVAAMIPVLIIFVIFQVLLSIIRASTVGMLRAVGMALLAVPATYILGGLVFVLLGASDGMAHWIIEAAAGSNGDDDTIGLQGIFQLFGMMYDPTANGGKGGVLLDANYATWAMAGIEDAPGQVILPWLIAAGITVICLILMLMMLFRTVAVLVLTMFAPVAVFSLSLEAAKAIFSKWLSVVVALMLAKPAAAAVVMFGVTMASLSSDWVQLVAGAVLILIAAAMPMFMLALVAFMTPDGAHRLEGAAVGAAVAGQRRVTGGARALVGGAQRTHRSVRSKVNSLGPFMRGRR